METTFDRELQEIALEKNLNFARYPKILDAVDIEFSPPGVKAHQQYAEAEGMESFYGDALSVFVEYLHQGVPGGKECYSPEISGTPRRFWMNCEVKKERVE